MEGSVIDLSASPEPLAVRMRRKLGQKVDIPKTGLEASETLSHTKASGDGGCDVSCVDLVSTEEEEEEGQDDNEVNPLDVSETSAFLRDCVFDAEEPVFPSWTGIKEASSPSVERAIDVLSSSPASVSVKAEVVPVVRSALSELHVYGESNGTKDDVTRQRGDQGKSRRRGGRMTKKRRAQLDRVTNRRSRGAFAMEEIRMVTERTFAASQEGKALLRAIVSVLEASNVEESLGSSSTTAAAVACLDPKRVAESHKSHPLRCCMWWERSATLQQVEIDAVESGCIEMAEVLASSRRESRCGASAENVVINWIAGEDVIGLLYGKDGATCMAKRLVDEIERRQNLLDRPRQRLILLVQGLNAALRDRLRDVPRRSTAPTPPSLLDVESALALVYTRLGVDSYTTTSFQESANYLLPFTALVAKAAYPDANAGRFSGVKKLRSTLSVTNPDASYLYSLEDIWLRFLQTIPGMSEQKARRVASFYPNSASLFEAYARVSASEGEALLETKISREKKSRALSRRIYHLFTSMRPDAAV